MTTEANIYLVDVTNKSNRPIRDVVCRIYPDPAKPRVSAKGIRKRAVIRAEANESFSFRDGSSGVERHYPWIMRFRDDVGVCWQLDQDGHLERVDHRDW